LFCLQNFDHSQHLEFALLLCSCWVSSHYAIAVQHIMGLQLHERDVNPDFQDFLAYRTILSGKHPIFPSLATIKLPLINESTFKSFIKRLRRVQSISINFCINDWKSSVKKSIKSLISSLKRIWIHW
jgi:hypothetical protein